MPKLVKETPEALRPFTHHGVSIDLSSAAGGQVTGECPNCGRDGKFYIATETGLWDCKVCGEKGNAIIFLRELWKKSDEATKDYSDLATSRKILNEETLMYWGVARSILTGEWLVPGYGIDGKLNTLYTYKSDFSRPGKKVLIPTPTMHHQLHGVNLWDAQKPVVYLCEGPWDAMVLWETLRGCKRDGAKFVPTANPATSLLSRANVLAVPGCGSIGEPFRQWAPLLAGKSVYLMFDSDHPLQNKKTGTMNFPAGFAACQRAVQLLSETETPPKEVHYLNWGPEGYDPEKPHGYDVRDALTETSDRFGALGRLLARCSTIPESWPARAKGSTSTGTKVGEDIECLPCDNYETVIEQFRNSGFKVTDGIDITLSIMLCCPVSTDAQGDQLWLKVIGPPSCGKSTLCEALSVSKKHIFANSVMTRIHSGWKTDKDGKDDHSLIPKINRKTLIVKDVDPLLQAMNKDIILSELRDLYDRVSRVHYGHGISRAYEGINLTIIFCGTSAIRQLDTSELGARFLDCVIVEDMDSDIEDEIGWAVANRADREMAAVSGPSSATQDGEAVRKAKQLTGGYINYLRENASTLLAGVQFHDEPKKMCQRLAKFVALMRARPSIIQQEKAECEMPFRLISQLVRLGKCLAVVLNHTEVDAEVMRRVRKVALDTARGQVLDIAKHLYKAGKTGAYVEGLMHLTGETKDKLGVMLKFLQEIKVVERFQLQVVLPGRATIITDAKPKFKLTEKMQELYKIAMQE